MAGDYKKVSGGCPVQCSTGYISLKSFQIAMTDKNDYPDWFTALKKKISHSNEEKESEGK